MNKNRGYILDTAIYAGSNLLSAGLPFLILPIVSRGMSVAEYGIVSMFTVFVSMFGAFTGLNIHGAVGVRFFQLDSAAMSKYMSSCIAVLFFSTSAVLLLMLPFLQPLAALSDLPWEWVLIAIAVSGATFVVQMQLIYWQSARRPFLFALLRVSQTMLDAALTLVLLGFGWTWQARTWAIAAAAFFAAAAAIFAMYRTRLITERPSLSAARDALAFGVPLVPNVLGALLVGYVDRIIIATNVSVAAAGLYSVAWQFGLVVGLLGDALNRAAVPWVYEALNSGSAEAKRRLVLAIYGSMVGFPLLGLLFLVAFQVLGGAVLPAEYGQAIQLIPWFIAGNVARCVYLLVINIAFFKSATYIASTASIISGIVGCACTLVLVGQTGVVAGGISFVIANLLALLIALSMSRKIVSLPWFDALKTLKRA